MLSVNRHQPGSGRQQIDEKVRERAHDVEDSSLRSE
jgi:hypothetical protein